MTIVQFLLLYHLQCTIYEILVNVMCERKFTLPTLTFPLVPQILLLRLSLLVWVLDAETDGVLKLFSSPLLSLRENNTVKEPL